ncbi:hypothetical protein [Streptomyces sp. CoH17]|uniref:hypothetical protein n=1 Tax=Streptomyces sp. CoH17 TaxID=2992806 RepID=UPI00226FC1A7|nr:hypothetical protein [Streptomyces sp. CoH17]
MDYGLFEHVAGREAEDEFEKEAAERAYLEAEHAVESRFGEFLRHAKNKDDFEQRLALVKNDLYNVIAKHTMPTPGIVRRIRAKFKSIVESASLTSTAFSKVAWTWDNQNRVFRAEGHDSGFTCPGCSTHHSELGFTQCKCGKIWNSWTIKPTADNKVAGGQVILCREVKVRDTVLSSMQTDSGFMTDVTSPEPMAAKPIAETQVPVVPSTPDADPLAQSGQGRVSSAESEDLDRVEAAGKKKEKKDDKGETKEERKNDGDENDISRPSEDSPDTPSSAPSSSTDPSAAALPISVKEIRTHKQNGLTAVCEGCGTAFNHLNVAKKNGKAHCPGCNEPATSANTLFVKRADNDVSYNEEAFIEGWKKAEAGESVPETEDANVLEGYVAFQKELIRREGWTGDLVPEIGAPNPYGTRSTDYDGSRPPIPGMSNGLADDHIQNNPSHQDATSTQTVREDFAQRADRHNEEGHHQDGGKVFQDPNLGTPTPQQAPNSNR